VAKKHEFTVDCNTENIAALDDFVRSIFEGPDSALATEAAAVKSAMLPELSGGLTFQASKSNIKQLYLFMLHCTQSQDATLVKRTFELLAQIDGSGEDGSLDPPPNGDPNG